MFGTFTAEFITLIYSVASSIVSAWKGDGLKKKTGAVDFIALISISLFYNDKGYTSSS